jgi:hypothetical protein
MAVQPQEDQAALARVTDLLHAFRSGSSQALIDAANTMIATPWRLMVDGDRSRVAFAVADELLGAAAQGGGTVAIQFGLAVVDAELDRVPWELLDPGAEILLRTVRGALLGERHYLETRLDDLEAAVRELEKATNRLRQLPQVVDEHNQGWCWLTYASTLTDHADITDRLDQRAAAVEALEHAAAVPGVRPQMRNAIRHKLAVTRVDYWKRVARDDAAATGDLVRACDDAIVELEDLIDDPVGHDVERRTWLQNLTSLKQLRRELRA